MLLLRDRTAFNNSKGELQGGLLRHSLGISSSKLVFESSTIIALRLPIFPRRNYLVLYAFHLTKRLREVQQNASRAGE
jgi:hypothetical protein